MEKITYFITRVTCARHRITDVLTKLYGGNKVDSWCGREAERLEVGLKGSRGVLQVESRENQLVHGAARRVNQVQQLSIVRPGEDKIM